MKKHNIYWLIIYLSLVTAYSPATAQSKQSLIRGYVAFKVWERDKSSKDIFIPGIHVYLKNLLDGTSSQPVLTDLSGRFTLSGDRDVRYQVCWKGKDFISDCDDSIISLTNDNKHIGNVYIQPQQRKSLASTIRPLGSQPTLLQPTAGQPITAQPRPANIDAIVLPEGLVLRPDFVLPPGFVLPQPSGRDYTTIYGQVRNNDGDIPRFLEPMANVNYFTEVAVLDENDQELNRVAVNNFGNYLLPKVPTKQKQITLLLSSENHQEKQVILKEANLSGSALHGINLQLHNSAPEIKPLIAKNALGTTVRQVLPGDELFIKADVKDQDGDAVKVRWMILNGSGEIDDPTAETISWKLPAAEGAYRIQMVAYDGKGGYNRSTVSVKANKEGLAFSGQVVDNQNNAIGKAEIEINGQQFISDQDGRFNSMVKNSDRFVLNIRKKGYGLVSKIYNNSVTGGKWVMTRANTFSNLDPSNDIQLVNKREYSECPGPEFLRLNWKGYPGLEQPVVQDGKGHVIAIGEPGVRFESLPLRKRYTYKNTFSDSEQTMRVGDFRFSSGEITKKGYLQVDSKNRAGGSGKDLQINNASVEFKYKRPVKKLTFRFGEYGGNVNLTVNGKLKNVGSLQLLNGDTIDRVKVKVQMDANNNTGRLTLSGPIIDLAIGGQEFWLDDVVEPLMPQIKVNRECGPGIQLKIPANSLVDANGNPPAGKINIDLTTVDLMSPRQMPGDYTVDIGGGNTGVMRSFGAGTVEIYDNNQEYNLKPGSTADLVIPVDQAQLAAGANLPNQIPLLYYNEKLGLWEEDGVGQLQGDNYVTKVKHFSSINMDLIKNDQSCIRISSPTLPASYTLEILLSDPDDPNAAPILKSANISNGPPSEHVVYNLPSNENVVLTPIRTGDSTPIGHFIVNTGGPQNPTNPNLPAGPPYDACATEVTLFERAIPDQPTAGEFLHGLTTFAATNLDELDPANPTENALLTSLQDATANYYSNIDPRNKRTTLVDFKNTNGFDATETRLSYANGGDLGFGRDMHCMKTNVDDDGDGIEEADEFDIACYVTNYGDITSDDATDAQDAQLAGLGGGSDPIATVAMEYSRIESTPGEPIEFDDPERVVKFFVYKGGDATPPAVAIDQDGNADGVLDQLLQNAALDSPLSSAPGDVDFRPRPVPQLCMVCHGGEYPGGPVTAGGPPFNSREEVKLGSKFIPFDSTYYAFPAAPFDEANPDVQLALKAMNEEFVLATNPGGPIERVISNLYTGANPNVQDEVDTITGWDSSTINRDMYHDVVSDTCRMCHASVSFPDIDFDTSVGFIDKLGQAENRVCLQHVMPHAKVTHDIFWGSNSPNMAAMFQVYGDTFGGSSGWNGQLCGDFTPGGDTPVSDYDTTIQPIFDNHCTGCHVGASPLGGLDLSLGNSYGNLVGVSSIELPTMPRITANDINNSYLYKKITNTHIAAGGSGDHMPPSSPLSTADAAAVQAIVDWINNGAPN